MSSTWMDEAWFDFASEHRFAMADLSVADLHLLKEAWLHGARTSLAKAQVAMSDFMVKTQEIARVQK